MGLCDWGRMLGLRDDGDPCQRQAERAMVLHDPHKVLGGRDRYLELCAEHFALVESETDPHAGAAS